jgi:hypothetical protein
MTVRGSLGISDDVKTSVQREQEKPPEPEQPKTAGHPGHSEEDSNKCGRHEMAGHCEDTQAVCNRNGCLD